MFCPKCGSENLEANKFCKKCGKNLPDKAQVQQKNVQTYAMPRTSNLLGEILDGRYRIEAKLGSGGMGDVYRATRLLVGDSIEVKILHPHLASDANAAERFRREAVTATRLRHRNIVAIYDVGISAVHSLPYILMEIAEGFTLRQIINQYRILPLEFIVTVTAQICSALEEAHSFGIVHRDIKPENIIVHQTTNGWQVKVLDFGIARLYDGSAEVGLTLDGNAMGTPQYMSPEQCMGETLDERSDVYSVGIVLYEMLCGTVPFKSPAASAVAVYQVQNQPAPPRSVNENIHPQIETVVLRVLAKQREMRPQTAQTLAQELIHAATIAYKDGYAPNQSFVVTPSDLRTVSTNAPPENKFTPSHTLSSELLVETGAANDSSELAMTEFVEIIAPKQTESIVENQNKEKLSQTEKLPVDEEKSLNFIEPENKSSTSEMNIREVSPEVKAELPRVFEEAESLLDEVFIDGKAKSDKPNETSFPPEKIKSFDASQPINIPSEPLPFHKNDNSLPETETQVLPITAKPKPNNTSNLIIAGIAVAIFVLFSAIGGVFWLSSDKDSSANTADVSNAAQNSSLNSQPEDTTTETSDSTTGSDKPQKPAAPDGMVYVAGGEFMLGSDTGDEYSRPARKVSVAPFFIDLTEVTNEEYKMFLDVSGRKPPPDWKNGTFPDGKARFPVTGVDWDDANAYAKWAGKRLPTEEEWEFAAKGTDNLIYPWGNDWKPEFSNADNQRNGMQEVGKSQGKSPFGLSDMSGNAWEWTASDAKAYPKGKNFDENLAEPKVIRGGYWGSSPKVATATGRRAYGARSEQGGYANTSFRCVKNISEK